jgi:hypothetical protein
LKPNLRRKWSTILKGRSQPSSSNFAIGRHASSLGGFLLHAALRFFEIARVFVRCDHVASFIVNADHGMM